MGWGRLDDDDTVTVATGQMERPVNSGSAEHAGDRSPRLVPGRFAAAEVEVAAELGASRFPVRFGESDGERRHSTSCFAWLVRT